MRLRSFLAWKWIVAAASGSPAARAEKCRVSNLKFDQGTLSFDRLDEALPMPVDPAPSRRSSWPPSWTT